MTAQASEHLDYCGQKLSMQSLPLEDYFKSIGRRPPFSTMATNNWRGYIGEWEIIDKRLYLTRLLQMGLRKTDTGVLPCLVPHSVSLGAIFPESNGSVFADWFTGDLHCPQGKLIEQYRGPLGAQYERYLVLSVQRGLVIHEEVVESVERVSTTDHEMTVETDVENRLRMGRFRAWLKRLL